MSVSTPPSSTSPFSHGRPDRPLSHDERQVRTTDLLLEASTESDPERRQALLATVVELNRRVAMAVARRYANRGIALDDLQQVACEGLVKAVQRFEVTHERDLLDYAVPTIRGEVLRHFRDQGWAVRPPRRIQELQQRMRISAEELRLTLGREPTPDEISADLGVSRRDQDEAASARGCFQPTSLDLPADAASGSTLGDLLPAAREGYDAAEARAVLAAPMRALDARDRRVIYLRFVEERTQSEIGDEFGVTQATVSRWLRESLGRLRSTIEPSSA
ncbi:sigma-70 family RNA polymerase sigma factor [uncultured Nocardioides sp.]|uniref:sigma-70 family RNA polymerase sigma factor n=1 Tax=uncultured Nocardioides sp. TaxID=198441 RepID=UPI00260FED61|nr:sigma-70 family RNA polymerase sigma factor [uncultured Nocardioides sp.]